METTENEQETNLLHRFLQDQDYNATQTALIVLTIIVINIGCITPRVNAPRGFSTGYSFFFRFKEYPNPNLVTFILILTSV